MWTNTIVRAAALALLCTLCAWRPQPTAAGQLIPQADTTITAVRGDEATRKQKLREARRAKRRALRPPVGPSRVHRTIRWLERQREQLRRGNLDPDLFNVSPVLGGLRTGAGLTGGLRLNLTRGEPDRLLALTARASLERYWGLEAQAAYELGPLLGYAFTQYRHMAREDFYGIGMQEFMPHTSFRHDEFVGGGLLGLRHGRRLLLGGHLTFMNNRVGPGGATDVPDVDDRFGADEVPALNHDIDYIIAAGFFAIDGRDVPASTMLGARFAPTRRTLRGLSLDARRGLYFAAVLSHYADRAGGSFTFTRADVDVHQYVPFRRGYHLLALRELFSLTHTADGHEVPFYLMPALGGKRTIRGFDAHRFHGRNAWLLNAEYRYQVWPLLDVALFTDVGQVFRNVGEVVLDEAAVGYGVGLRIKTRRRLLARIDLARSREGFALELSLSSIL